MTHPDTCSNTCLDTFSDTSQSSNFVVCCYFTPNYKTYADTLKASAKACGLNYHLKQIDDQGYWEANTRVKPAFVLECLEKFPDKHVLYLDADAVIKRPLTFFESLEADMAVYHTHKAAGMSHDYLTGTLFFKNNSAVRAFVRCWLSKQAGSKRTQVDQDSFEAAMQQMHTSAEPSALTMVDLPLGYIKIFDKDYDGEVYIEQYQASRSQTKLRRTLIRRRNRLIGVAVVFAIVLFLVLKLM